MEYKIISADETIGQIQVTYYSGDEALATYAIDVPVVNGHYITGEALDTEIMSRAPVWLLQRKQEVSAAANFASISSLVTPVAAPTGATGTMPVIAVDRVIL